MVNASDAGVIAEATTERLDVRSARSSQAPECADKAVARCVMVLRSFILCLGDGDIAIEGGARDPQGLADVADRVLFGIIERLGHRDLRRRPQLLRPTAQPPARPGRGQPRLGPLADEVALE